MDSYTFALVDVFTERPLSGNQLPVILNAEGLDDGQLQAIAREFNYSETTFILPPRQAKADWRLRSFTKKEEVFGSGHHTLGAWWALAALGKLDLRDPETTFWQEIGRSVSPVSITSEGASEGAAPLRVAMTQDKPRFGNKPADIASLARALGLEVSDFDLERLEPQAVYTGATHLLTPARSLSVLERVRVDPEKLIAVTRPDMKQQTGNVSGELRAADGAGFEENLLGRRANHAKRFVYLRLRGGDKLCDLRGRRPRNALFGQKAELLAGEIASCGIGQQAINTSGDVSQVKTH